MTTPVEPFDHPNLSPEINKAIRESDEAGGIWLKDISGGYVKVQTRNTLYFIRQNPDKGAKWLIKGHPKFCPDWSECNIHGSTFGGSMIKVGFIGRGMYMEFSIVGDAKDEPGCPAHATITTSQIQDVHY